MRLRLLPAFGVIAVLMLAGCTAPPAPSPSQPSTASSSPTPTPTSAEAAPPEIAFDVSCDDVAVEMATVLGEMGPVAPVLSTVSTMNWIPGPAQHMFARAGGIACSAGDATRVWEVTIVPNAQSVIDGAAERGGYGGESSTCNPGGYCDFAIFADDVLLSATVTDPAMEDAAAAQTIDTALRRLLERATSTLHDVSYVPSEITDIGCEQALTAAELGGLLGSEVWLIQEFGGWGIPAEIYEIVNGSDICYYTSGPDPYEAQGHVMITSLPAGAWAFEQVEGTPVMIENADAAVSGVDVFERPVLDLRIGTDWIRLASYDAQLDLVPIAEAVAHNLTVGHPAPQ